MILWRLLNEIFKISTKKLKICPVLSWGYIFCDSIFCEEIVSDQYHGHSTVVTSTWLGKKKL